MERLKILIADDEEKIVRLVSDFLSNSGYETITALDGKKALDIFREEKENLSLAIIDIMMPEIDGWALTKEIRKTSDLPIIMLSARAEEFDLLTGFEAGIDAKVVQGYLGHFSISITLDLYTHVTNDKARTEMNKLENLYEAIL